MIKKILYVKVKFLLLSFSCYCYFVVETDHDLVLHGRAVATKDHREVFMQIYCLLGIARTGCAYSIRVTVSRVFICYMCSVQKRVKWKCTQNKTFADILNDYSMHFFPVPLAVIKQQSAQFKRRNALKCNEIPFKNLDHTKLQNHCNNLSKTSINSD